jgi:hypothetical protein
MAQPTRTTGTTPEAPKVAVADTQAAKTKALAESRSAAVSKLVAAHREEFNELMKVEAANRKVAWKPKPTAEEKALAEAQALLKANPGLAEKLGLTPAPEVTA